MKKVLVNLRTVVLWLGGSILCFGLLGATAGGAMEEQAVKDKVEVLEELAVTATRTEMKTFDIPQSVTVITEEQIKASPHERVEDIIRQAAGVYNFRHYTLHTNGVVSPIRMRGTGNNRTLMLVDGIPQNDNFNNSIAWVGWGYVPKDAIERIEIVRGPMSALYGSEGLGGVINIITKNPKAPRETTITTKAGTANTFGGDVYYRDKFKNLGLLVAGGGETSRGFFMEDPRESYMIRRYGETGKAFGKAFYEFSPQTNVSFTGLYYKHDHGQGRKYFFSTLALDQYWLQFNHKFDKGMVKLLLFMNRAHKTAYQDSAADNYSSLDRKEKFPSPYVWGADLQATLIPAPWATITAGATYKDVFMFYDEDYIKVLREAGCAGSQTFLSPFINLDFQFFKGKLLGNLGARFDWIESSKGRSWDTKPPGGLQPYHNDYPITYWTRFSPKGGLVFHPDPQTALKFAAGTGFRVPSLFELYKTHVRGGGTYTRFPNPLLKPEKITSYEVGVERLFFNQLLARATFYQSNARDYIGDKLLRTYYVKKKKTFFKEYQLDNISKVYIHGVEVDLEWNPRNVLSIFGNYTYNVSKVVEDLENPQLEGKYLPQAPRHMFHLGVLYKNPRIANIYLLGNYYDVMFYDSENTFKGTGYFTLDASIYRTFFDHVTLRLDAENIFNRKYTLFKAVDGRTIVPGIIVMGKVIFSF
ncbi:MAG: TonB-dependent receptor plug domain-containing protein [Desulfobaccales bacterium]